MKRGFAYVVTLVLMALSTAALAARVGEPAPNFTAIDSNGKVAHAGRLPRQVRGARMA